MRGKTIHSDGRNIILKVLKFFDDEKSNKRMSYPLDKVIQRTCAANGPSTSTASPSANTELTEPRLSTPGKKRKRATKKRTLDNFDLVALRNIVNSFYTVKKEIPTLRKILTAANRDINFLGEKGTLRKILIDELGYKFKKCKNARTILIQKPDIAAWRVFANCNNYTTYRSNTTH
ncbi:hypothetical protein ACJJTC_018728 [Scirpophaga incertulas]